MSPQVKNFAKSIRELLPNYEGPEQAAKAYRQGVEKLGFMFDADMSKNLDAAVELVRQTMQNIQILHRNSIFEAHEDWYTGPGPGDRHWPALSAFLLNVRKWGEETCAALDQSSNEIVSLLANPKTARFQYRGLVVGYVQSGKTASMTAVIAKAVDAGYNLVVILGGVTNKLRAQTQRRIVKDVAERHRHLWTLYTTPEDSGDFNVPANEQFTMPQEGQAQLIVMKKEGTRLKSLLTTITKSPAVVKEKLRVLIIDDECDQASVNSAKGEFDMTVINAAIRRLLKKIPAVTYVGYTATPFANVFINPFPNNKEDLDDLYPRDFITALPRPREYFGAREVFGRNTADPEDEGMDMVRAVEGGEPDLLRPTKTKDKDVFKPSMTTSLRDAVLWFLATCAIRRIRGQQAEHMSMLVHVSPFVRQHEYIADLIKNWLLESRTDLMGKSGPVSARFESLYIEESTRTAPEGHEKIPESLEEIWAKLPGVLDDLAFAVENGRSELRLDYENGPKTYIAVGGTVLARGLTLEGLAVSFFLRTSKQYDTLLQMGRWFGYRIGYSDLPRLWTTADLAGKFRALSFIEEEIRDDIQVYRDRKVTPREFAIRVRSLPGMAITSASKMRNAFPTSMSFDGQHVQTIRFDHREKDTVWRNWDAASKLVVESGERGKKDARADRMLWTGVPREVIRKFLVTYSISASHMNLKSEHLLKYLDNAGDMLASWNVAIIQSGAGKPAAEPLGPLKAVMTVNRSQMIDSEEDVADIKALMSKDDILVDVPEDRVKALGVKRDWNMSKSARHDVPLLLMYPIHRTSTASSSARKPLDAVNDLLGIGIVFPGVRDRSGTYFAVELEPLANDDLVEDELDEIEAADADSAA